MLLALFPHLFLIWNSDSAQKMNTDLIQPQKLTNSSIYYSLNIWSYILSVGFILSAKVMHIQMYLPSAHENMHKHKFGNMKWSKWSRIVLNNLDYFISSEFTTVSLLGRFASFKGNKKYSIKVQFEDGASRGLTHQYVNNSIQ